MLIRRDIFIRLAEKMYSLYPYPIQKLLMAASVEGIYVERIHESMPKPAMKDPYLLVPTASNGILRAKTEERKKILVITHELSWTGAPLVLAEACKEVLKPAGYEMLVVSPKAGPAASRFLEQGISVLTVPEILSTESRLLCELIHPYDMVIVNTIVPFAVIRLLNELKKPVLWWIHENELMYHGIAEHLPVQLKEHMHVYCVGPYALNVLKRYCNNYNAQSLIYGLKDQNPSRQFWYTTSKKSLRFATVGSLVSLKGQDVLIKAVSLLREDVREKCEFLFVGKVDEEAILATIKEAEKAYPGQVSYIGQVARDILDTIYPDVDVIICPSRYDCMPTYVAEGMMYGKPVICSENTGTAPIVQEMGAGLIYSDNDPCKLAEAITEFVEFSDETRQKYAQRARVCFEERFRLDGFRQKLLQIMDEIMAQEVFE